nr:MAG TPA: hypothetical protein [Bacteriophage sp.]
MRARRLFLRVTTCSRRVRERQPRRPLQRRSANPVVVTLR